MEPMNAASLLWMVLGVAAGTAAFGSEVSKPFVPTKLPALVNMVQPTYSALTSIPSDG